MAIAMCTIVSKNYLSFARTLVDSYLEKHPNGKAFVLLVDINKGEIDGNKEKFELIELKQLHIPEEASFYFKYNITELNTAVKPYLLDYLFNKYKIDKLLYFDPDILIMQNLNKVYQLLDHHFIVLTPHILSPINDFLKPNEIDLLRAGAYNLGFIGLAKSETVFNFLHWWKNRLYDYCLIDLQKGLFVDQRWIDLVPSMYDNTYILRDPAYNMAYWNLHERKLNLKNGTYYVMKDKPLVFYHFSGFNFNLNKISTHQDRFTWNDIPHLNSLFQLYKQKLLTNDYLKTKDYQYSFDYFDNGDKIPSIARKMYNSLGNQALAFKNPFHTHSRNSFYQWLVSPVNNKTKVPRLMNEIYRNHPFLNNKFPDSLGKNQHSLIQWARKNRIMLQNRFGIEGKLLKLMLAEL